MEYQYKTAQTFHSYIPCDLASTHYHYNLWYFNSTSMGKTAMLFFEIRPDKGVFTRLASWLENFHCYYYYTRRRRREKIETLKYFDISSFCSKHAGMWEWKFLKRKSLFYSVYKANLNNPSIPPLLFYRLIWSPTWLNYRNWKKRDMIRCVCMWCNFLRTQILRAWHIYPHGFLFSFSAAVWNGSSIYPIMHSKSQCCCITHHAVN